MTEFKKQLEDAALFYAEINDVSFDSGERRAFLAGANRALELLSQAGEAIETWWVRPERGIKELCDTGACFNKKPPSESFFEVVQLTALTAANAKIASLEEQLKKERDSYNTLHENYCDEVEQLEQENEKLKADNKRLFSEVCMTAGIFKQNRDAGINHAGQLITNYEFERRDKHIEFLSDKLAQAEKKLIKASIALRHALEDTTDEYYADVINELTEGSEG